MIHGPLPLSLARLTLSALVAEIARLESAQHAAYWTFTRSAASRCGAAVASFAPLAAALRWTREAHRRERLYLAQRLVRGALLRARVATQRPNVEGWARAVAS